MSQSIAIIVPELLPVPAVKGGAVEHWVEEVSVRMLNKGRRLAIVSRPAGVRGVDGIEYISIPWTATEVWFHRIKEKVTWRNPLRFVGKIQNVAAYGFRVARIVRNFDLVYIHNEPNILLFIRKRKGQKIVLHMHNDHLSSPLFKAFYRRALSKVDRVVCVSDYIRRCAVSTFPEFDKKFVSILNATDPRFFRPYGDVAVAALKDLVDFDSSCRYLLYAGRLAEIKGVHVLIDAFTKIHASFPNTRLIIAGSSFFGGAAKTAYEERLVKLAMPVSDTIIFTGFLSHDKLKYLYSAVDVICMPSIWQEPISLVVLEALASGSCLVASRVGGVPEVVDDGRNGVLVPPGDSSALADAVVNLLTNPEKKALMEQTAREIVSNTHHWGRLVAQIEAEFEALR